MTYKTAKQVHNAIAQIAINEPIYRIIHKTIPQDRLEEIAKQEPINLQKVRKYLRREGKVTYRIFQYRHLRRVRR